nr:hypothetical protein KPHV_86670 [Kitasatospora purpeofusca]
MVRRGGVLAGVLLSVLAHLLLGHLVPAAAVPPPPLPAAAASAWATCAAVEDGVEECAVPGVRSRVGGPPDAEPVPGGSGPVRAAAASVRGCPGIVRACRAGPYRVLLQVLRC